MTSGGMSLPRLCEPAPTPTVRSKTTIETEALQVISIGARVFLFGRELADPPLDLRRKLPRPRQGDRRLNPSVMGHGKGLDSLPASAVGCARASAPICEQDRAHRRGVLPVVISVGVGIVDS